MNYVTFQELLIRHPNAAVLLLALSITGLIILLLDSRSSRTEFFKQRLHTAMDVPEATSAQWLNNSFAAMPTLLLGKAGRIKMTQLLMSAGFRSQNALIILALIKWFLGCSGAIGVLLYLDKGMTIETMPFSALGFVFGGAVPEKWLLARAKKIRHEIISSIPDALDLLVACVEAGLTLEKSIERVGKELASVAPALSQELLTTYAELLVTGNRKKALTNLATRVQISELENMSYTLAQSDRYGTPIGKPLRNIASESRANRLLDMEEQIGKLPAKMSLPLVGFVLFPLVILMVAPPVIMTLRILGGK